LDYACFLAIVCCTSPVLLHCTAGLLYSFFHFLLTFASFYFDNSTFVQQSEVRKCCFMCIMIAFWFIPMNEISQRLLVMPDSHLTLQLSPHQVWYLTCCLNFNLCSTLFETLQLHILSLIKSHVTDFLM